MNRQGKSFFQKSYELIVTVIILITMLTLFGIYSIQQEKKQVFYAEKVSTLRLAHSSNIEKYKLLANWIFEEYINKQEVLSLFAKAQNSHNEDKKRYFRGLLYQKLANKYEQFAKYDIRQLHFHTPANRSFLRFHKPDKLGDDLTYMRSTLTRTNELQKFSCAFETGRVVSGFRNVFPLNYKGRHIGSVEISAITEAILKTLSSLDRTKNYRFILNKDTVYPKLFEKQKRLYSPSNIHPGFIKEDANKLLIKHDEYNYAFEKDINTINKKLAKLPGLKKALDKGESFGHTLKHEESYQSVVFLPMKGISGSLEGYLISYGKEKNIPYIITNIWLVYALVLLGSIFFIVLLSLIKRKADTIDRQRNWFISIMNSLSEGLYVMNKKGALTFINDSACKILGYKQEELLDKHAHSIFHAHKEDPSIKKCPIYSTVMQKQDFYSDKEYFKNKNTTLFPVDVNSSPLLVNGKVDQIVTTFKDISIQKEMQNKMHMLTTALESSMNAVVITDKEANIEWVNPAFETMTGFSSNESIGKKPKDLVFSGEQNREFYETLWATILAKKAWRGELINKRKDESLYYEELSITPVLDEVGQIQHFIAIKQDISLRKEHEKNMETLAFYDILTKLPNRRLFIDRFETLLAQMKRNSFYSALLFLDLDKFKIINDTHGHEAGDVVLQESAKRLKALTRDHDTVARFGGDEFVILISHLDTSPEKSYNDMQKIADKICQSFRLPFYYKNESFNLSISVGTFLFNKKENSLKSLFKKADEALYEAKAKGRDIYFISVQK